MGRGKGKGNGYEREICKLLSLWWTEGKTDDCFWRSSSSGGRATARGRKGKKTQGHHGDLAATSPIGEPFIDFVTVEIKRGYSEETVAELFDRKPQACQQRFEEFFEQVIESWENSGSFSWMLIHRRDRREPLVYMPWPLVRVLRDEGCFIHAPNPFCTFHLTLRFRNDTRKVNERVERVSCMLLEEWLSCVSPGCIMELSKQV